MNSLLPHTLSDAAVTVLTTGDALEKARLTRIFAAAWRDGAIGDLGHAVPPTRPARPTHPELRHPKDMPKRGRGQSLANRIALLHAIAHIELNAIDLAWDILARFHTLPDDTALPIGFHTDWLRVADEEALHFTLVAERLASLGAAYGDLPAHDGLWQASEATSHDLPARLAVVPMVLEARGLDVTPGIIDSLTKAGDHDSVAVLHIILRDEVGHVATGRHWFQVAAQCLGLEAGPWWQQLVRQHFKGELKRPFNGLSRDLAGLPSDWYEPLAGN